MQTNSKQQHNGLATIFAKVCSFICIGVFTLGFLSCRETNPTPAKTVRTQKEKVSKPAPKDYVIRYIDADGYVLIGKRDMTPQDCKSVALSVKSPAYKLEGLAEVNDPFVFITELEQRTLSSGEVKIVPIGHYVQSTRHH